MSGRCLPNGDPLPLDLVHDLVMLRPYFIDIEWLRWKLRQAEDEKPEK